MMMNKVKELRQQIPVPVTEALRLLRENDGDIEACVYLFKAASIRQICEQTGCDETMANKFYETEKYDLNRSISFIRDELYDLSYLPIEGITASNIRRALQWVKTAEAENFACSLDMEQLSQVIDTLSRIEELEAISQMLQKAKNVRDEIFEGYTDSLPMQDFVRRHKRLDDAPDFARANQSIPNRLVVVNEILLRHLRNVSK